MAAKSWRQGIPEDTRQKRVSLKRTNSLTLHDIHEIPGILVEFQLDLTLLIHLQFGRRKESALSFLLVFTVSNFHSCQVVVR